LSRSISGGTPKRRRKVIRGSAASRDHEDWPSGLDTLRDIVQRDLTAVHEQRERGAVAGEELRHTREPRRLVAPALARNEYEMTVVRFKRRPLRVRDGSRGRYERLGGDADERERSPAFRSCPTDESHDAGVGAAVHDRRVEAGRGIHELGEERLEPGQLALLDTAGAAHEDERRPGCVEADLTEGACQVLDALDVCDGGLDRPIVLSARRRAAPRRQPTAPRSPRSGAHV
jgi:hypothetical protein